MTVETLITLKWKIILEKDSNFRSQQLRASKESFLRLLTSLSIMDSKLNLINYGLLKMKNQILNCVAELMENINFLYFYFSPFLYIIFIRSNCFFQRKAK